MKIKTIIVIVSFLWGVSLMGIYANDEGISAIIFWDYSENLSLQILEEDSLDKNLETFKTVLVIPLADVSFFSKHTQEFFLIDTSLRKIESQGIFTNLYEKSDGGSLYFSIVIDGEIAMNGLNRMLPPPAARKPKDDLVVPRIVWTRNDTLKITMDNVSFFWGFPSREEEDRELIDCEKIDKYFSLRNKLE